VDESFKLNEVSVLHGRLQKSVGKGTGNDVLEREEKVAEGMTVFIALDFGWENVERWDKRMLQRKEGAEIRAKLTQD
jgi:hypothetical protein